MAGGDARAAGSPGAALGAEYLLLALDPHVLHALLDVLALVRAALLALLQPRRRVHHLHGRDGHAAAALPGHEIRGGKRVKIGTAARLELRHPPPAQPAVTMPGQDKVTALP